MVLMQHGCFSASVTFVIWILKNSLLIAWKGTFRFLLFARFHSIMKRAYAAFVRNAARSCLVPQPVFRCF